jgi:cytochrome P450
MMSDVDAAVDTSVVADGTAVLSLLHSDEQRASLLTDPDGLSAMAVEEVLRRGLFEMQWPRSAATPTSPNHVARCPC